MPLSPDLKPGYQDGSREYGLYKPPVPLSREQEVELNRFLLYWGIKEGGGLQDGRLEAVFCAQADNLAQDLIGDDFGPRWTHNGFLSQLLWLAGEEGLLDFRQLDGIARDVRVDSKLPKPFFDSWDHFSPDELVDLILNVSPKIVEALGPLREFWQGVDVGRLADWILLTYPQITKTLTGERFNIHDSNVYTVRGGDKERINRWAGGRRIVIIDSDVLVARSPDNKEGQWYFNSAAKGALETLSEKGYSLVLWADTLAARQANNILRRRQMLDRFVFRIFEENVTYAQWSIGFALEKAEWLTQEQKATINLSRIPSRFPEIVFPRAVVVSADQDFLRALESVQATHPSVPVRHFLTGTSGLPNFDAAIASLVDNVFPDKAEAI